MSHSGVENFFCSGVEEIMGRIYGIGVARRPGNLYLVVLNDPAAPPSPRGASNSPSPPRGERGGSGLGRGGTNENAATLPSPLLHPMAERENSRSLMQPCLVPPAQPVLAWIVLGLATGPALRGPSGQFLFRILRHGDLGRSGVFDFHGGRPINFDFALVVAVGEFALHVEFLFHQRAIFPPDFSPPFA